MHRHILASTHPSWEVMLVLHPPRPDQLARSKSRKPAFSDGQQKCLAVETNWNESQNEDEGDHTVHEMLNAVAEPRKTTASV